MIRGAVRPAHAEGTGFEAVISVAIAGSDWGFGSVSFLDSWGLKCGPIPAPPLRSYTPVGLLNDLENQLERQIPAQLQTALQQALDDYRPVGPDSQLTMPRHHQLSPHHHHQLRRHPPASPGVPLRPVPPPQGYEKIIGGTTLLGNDALDRSRSLSAVLKKPATGHCPWRRRGCYARAGQCAR